MEFTREAWENAPEGARLECKLSHEWKPVEIIGYTRRGQIIVEGYADEGVFDATHFLLRIILPKRKVTVQLWRDEQGRLFTNLEIQVASNSYTLLGEHTFEIEGE